MGIRSRIAMIALAATTAAAIPAAGKAQIGTPLPVLPGAHDRARVVEIPCCTCVDGRVTTTPLSTGAAAWTVSGPGISGTVPVVAASHSAWASVAPAAWVGPSAAPTGGTYVYKIVFRVPDCVIGGKVTISGRFAADNSAVLSVNGAPVFASQGTWDYGFQAGSITPFSKTLTPGIHTLEVRVYNTSDVTGLAVQANVVTVCPKELERRR